MFKLTDQQFQQLAVLEATNSPTRYADIYDLIDGWLENLDPSGFAAPGNLQAWFGAAAQANRGEGAASDFIRTYTEAQLEIRSGNEISSVDTLLQGASDAIAQAVMRDIEASADPINGEIFYTIPDLQGIGDQDASQTLAALPNFSNQAIWSGNLLFIGLGDDSFWAETALESSGDTYDIAVAARSAVAAGIGTLYSGGFGELMAQFWFQGAEGRSEAAAAATTALDGTTAFWEDAYGVYGESGTSGLAFTGITFGLTVGSDGDDFSLEQQGLAGRYFVHGGGGNDLIVGSRGTGILDGGAGFDDIVSYEPGNGGSLTASLFFVDSTARFSANVVGDDIDAAIFNTENLTLTREDDVLDIDTSTLTNSSLNEVNGAGQSSIGDTVRLDGNFVTQGVQVSLEDETLSITDGGSLSIIGFENIIGSRYRDTMTGDDADNIIDGGDKRDVISGNGGNDRLLGGTGNDKLRGDDGNDILEGQADKDNLGGGAGNDLLFASQYFADPSEELASESLLRGNAGDDILVADAGGNSLIGGGGRDVLIGGAGIDTLEGGGSHDLIITRGGADEIRGGKGNDWIYALGPNSDAFVFFDEDSGHDFIQQDEQGLLGGVSEITFEDLATGDVDLVWDFEVLSSENFDDYEEDQFGNFNNLSQELGGHAVIVSKSTDASINLGYIEGSRFFRDETLATEGSELTTFFIELPEQTNLVFTDQDASDVDFGLLVNFLDSAPIGREIGPDGNPITIFGEVDRGLLSIENLMQGSIAPYDNAPNQFLNNFDNAFAADLSTITGTETLLDATTVLSEETVTLLTDDIFDFV